MRTTVSAGLHAGGRERLVPGQDAGKHLALLLTAHDQRDQGLRVQVRERERDPGVQRLHARHRDVDERAGIGELLVVARVERGRVAV